jgi:OmpA-OmpF porin, OOP family
VFNLLDNTGLTSPTKGTTMIRVALFTTTLAMMVFVHNAAFAQQHLTAEEILSSLQNNAEPTTLTADEILSQLEDSFSVTEEDPNVSLPSSKTAEIISNLPKLDFEIFFDYNSASIKPESLTDLIEMGKALSSPGPSGKHFVVGGHTDAAGSNTYNANLGRKRAEAIRDFLIRTFPIEGDNLAAFGFGEEELRDPKNPEAAINRRVQIVNLGN